MRAELAVQRWVEWVALRTTKSRLESVHVRLTLLVAAMTGWMLFVLFLPSCST